MVLMNEILLFVQGVPWAEVGFWFSAVWTLLGLGVFLISWGATDQTAPLIGFAVFSVPVLVLSLFGHLAFAG